MPVVTHSYVHFQTPEGPPPGSPEAPTLVTSITREAGATISFLPGDPGDAAVSSWTVTPYISGTAQTPQTISAASATTIDASDSNTYTQVQVTSLTNSTAYTFSVHGTNSTGTGAESGQSGANTPLSGLVFGDDFNGPAGAFPDPEWWVYNPRCGYLAQSEVAYYLGDHCVLDGNGNLKITAEHTSYTGPKYPSAGGGSITQPWRSGACQSNTKTWAPAAGNTMTFEARFQVNADCGNGFWPGFFWLEGQDYLDAWKTDPYQAGWDSTGKAEIDVAEWTSGHWASNYATNVYTGSSYQVSADSGATNLSQAMHTYAARWKPGTSVSFWRDGSQTSSTGVSPASGARLFLMLYLQMLAGGPTTTESIYTDWVRVYDQNLG